MSLLTILAIAAALAMDAFAVAVAVGIALERMGARHVLRLAAYFGFFQFLMPVAGYAAGLSLRRFISAYDHWVAFALLLGIGAKMIYEAFQEEKLAKATDPTRGLTVLVLSLATSIDALAVGLSLSLLRVEIWYPSIIIGAVAALLTAVGMVAGRRLGARLGVSVEILGGLILIGIGVSILVRHLADGG